MVAGGGNWADVVDHGDDGQNLAEGKRACGADTSAIKLISNGWSARGFADELNPYARCASNLGSQQGLFTVAGAFVLLKWVFRRLDCAFEVF